MKIKLSKISRIFNRIMLFIFGLGLVVFSSCHKDPVEPEDPIIPLYGVKAEKFKEIQIDENLQKQETLETQNSIFNE